MILAADFSLIQQSNLNAPASIIIPVLYVICYLPGDKALSEIMHVFLRQFSKFLVKSDTPQSCHHLN